VTEIWLRAEGVSKKKALQFRDFDALVVEYEWNAEIPRRGSIAETERQQRIGRLLDRWEVRPPELPATLTEQPHDTGEADRQNELYRSAHFRAQALLGPGAPWQDMAHVVQALVDGATDDQALAGLRQAQERLAAERQP